MSQIYKQKIKSFQPFYATLPYICLVILSLYLVNKTHLLIIRYDLYYITNPFQMSICKKQRLKHVVVTMICMFLQFRGNL